MRRSIAVPFPRLVHSFSAYADRQPSPAVLIPTDRIVSDPAPAERTDAAVVAVVEGSSAPELFRRLIDSHQDGSTGKISTTGSHPT